ncbi:hypothetical protein CBER1_11905 [Cercospora berteroae]|uniref:Uncharacterized protein n=1 Tax=Cercospora berteroae TaxID=357750 RepID=A0A2S6C0N4_9PEZI|nr:hypothetical protein CBER1_11905 [Cercospora berteroae]
MDAMLTSFHSSTPAQLNNFIVYSGPPTAKSSKRNPAKGNPKMREDDDPLARTSPTEDFVGQPDSFGHQACGTAIVAPGAAEAYMDVAADEYHLAEDSTTAGIDGGDLSAGRLGFPCDFSEWSGLDNDIRFKGQTGIESGSPT